MRSLDDLWSNRFLLTRRQVLLLGTASLLSGCSLRLVKPERCEDRNSLQCLGFELFRLEDNFSAHLEIYGFEIKTFWGRACLTAQLSLQPGSHRFVFHFPPQHYAETVIERPSLDRAKIDKNIDDLLKKIGLLAAKPSTLVFNIPINEAALPIHGKAMPFDLRHLLAWDKFDYVLENAEDPYEEDGEFVGTTQQSRQYVLGFESWKGKGLKQTSAIDLPAGFYLQPLKDQKIRWKSHADPKRAGSFTQFWSAFITGDRAEDINFELVDIWGVAGGLEGKKSGNVLSYTYFNTKKQLAKDVPISRQMGDNTSSIQFETSPLTFFDRMDIAATLSPRLRKNGPSDIHVALDYLPGEQARDECGREKTLRFKPCYDVDHFLTAKTYGISADGGWLDVQGNWSVRPGCTVKGWVQKTTRGRDSYVKVVRKGWLYPFGIEAELVEETERTYVRDSSRHFVAPLVRQVYVRLVPPAFMLGSSVEECFTSIQILTERTPPLDQIEITSIQGGPSIQLQHKQLDAFIPMVGKSAFNFELEGIDHNKQKVQWAMPLFFLSNRQTEEADDGRFPESASEPPAANDANLKTELHYVRAVKACGGQDNGLAVTNFIKLIDILWTKLPYRFAKLNGQIVAVTPQDKEGDTSVEVKWVEWVRGRRVDPLTEEARMNGFQFVTQPIKPRLRTARIALQGLRQFSGQLPDMLATYRDMRIQHKAGKPQSLEWTLDPEEDQGRDDFNAGLLDPSAPHNEAGVFMCVLPAEGKEARESTERRIAVLNTYYRLLSDSTTINDLFSNLGNTVEYGEHKSTSELGACRPDSKIAILTRQYGPLGDESQDRDRLSKELDDREAMDSSPLLRFTASGNSISAGIVNLGMNSLFGTGGEIIPGVKFSDIIGYVLQSGGTEEEKATFGPELIGEQQGGDNGPVWKTRIVGAEGLLSLFEVGPSLDRLKEALIALAESPAPDEPVTRLSVGMESTLDWETSSFKDFSTSFFAFSPKRSGSSREARFIIHARAWTDFLDPRPQISAVSKLTDFSVEFLGAIVVEFDYVRFEVDVSGRQIFDPAIASVSFKGRLAFIDGLKSLLNSLSDELGIKINVTPQRVSVSQTISFPPQGGGVVFLGPASISNLTFTWGVIIPIIGRDRMRIAVALASRENPMTIAVGIYGGRAYALIEADTTGPRLIEIYADYGGIFQADWSKIAKGTVSLTAGFGFSINSGAEGSVQLIAFSQFSGRVDVWIFSLCANVIVGLGYEQGSNGQALFGLAKCSCSFNLGLAEYKYRYEVYKRECSEGCNSAKSIVASHSGTRDKDLPALTSANLVKVDQEEDSSGSAHPNQAIRVDYFWPFKDPSRLAEWRDFFDASVPLQQ